MRKSWACGFLFPGRGQRRLWAGAVTQGHSWESDPKRNLGRPGSRMAPGPSGRNGSPKKHLERTHPIPAQALQGCGCPDPWLVAGRGQGGRLGCAPGFRLSGVCTAATQAEAHVHLGTGATSHPRVCDTGASETRAPVLVPAVHKSPAVTTGTRALRDLHAAPRKKQNKTKNSPLHPTPPGPGPFRGWCPLHPRTNAHLLRA